MALPTRSDLVLTRIRCSLIGVWTRSILIRRRPSWACGLLRAPRNGLSFRPSRMSNGYVLAEICSRDCKGEGLRYANQHHVVPQHGARRAAWRASRPCCVPPPSPRPVLMCSQHFSFPLLCRFGFSLSAVCMPLDRRRSTSTSMATRSSSRAKTTPVKSCSS